MITMYFFSLLLEKGLAVDNLLLIFFCFNWCRGVEWRKKNTENILVFRVIAIAH